MCDLAYNNTCIGAGADQLFGCHYLTGVTRNVLVDSPIQSFVLSADKHEDVGLVLCGPWIGVGDIVVLPLCEVLSMYNKDNRIIWVVLDILCNDYALRTGILCRKQPAKLYIPGYNNWNCIRNYGGHHYFEKWDNFCSFFLHYVPSFSNKHLVFILLRPWNQHIYNFNKSKYIS